MTRFLNFANNHSFVTGEARHSNFKYWLIQRSTIYYYITIYYY